MGKKKLVWYIHGEGGSIEETEHYKRLYCDCDVIGLDYKSFTPWEMKSEIQHEVGRLQEQNA